MSAPRSSEDIGADRAATAGATTWGDACVVPPVGEPHAARPTSAATTPTKAPTVGRGCGRPVAAGVRSDMSQSQGRAPLPGRIPFPIRPRYVGGPYHRGMRVLVV